MTNIAAIIHLGQLLVNGGSIYPVVFVFTVAASFLWNFRGWSELQGVELIGLTGDQATLLANLPYRLINSLKSSQPRS